MNDLLAISGALRHLATADAAARRRHEEDDDQWLAPFGSPYAVDRDKLLCSKAIRRLRGKAQTVFHPTNFHMRDRVTHSFEVAQVAAVCARILGLNEALVVAMALGHDLGHTPYGHPGETFLCKASGMKFRHEVFSVVVVQHIERQGRGLNLTHQTLRGMLLHSRGAGALDTSNLTAEEAVVMYADKIAYLFADYNDLLSPHFKDTRHVTVEDFPHVIQAMEAFGQHQRGRVERCVTDLCLESAAHGCVSFADSSTAQEFNALKSAMYAVYYASNAKDADERMRIVYEFLTRALPDMPTALLFALMNDDDLAYLLNKYGERALTPADIAGLSIAELLPSLRGREIDLTNPDLDW